MGYLERNSETWKTPGFSGFECRVSGIGRVSIFGFGSGSGSKKVGLFPRVSGFRVQRPITSLDRRKFKFSNNLLGNCFAKNFVKFNFTFSFQI